MARTFKLFLLALSVMLAGCSEAMLGREASGEVNSPEQRVAVDYPVASGALSGTPASAFDYLGLN